MPKILILYYTQTGQLKDILDSLVSDIRDQTDITWGRIEPAQPFPFPWTSSQFFDAMPESVEQVPVALKPLPHTLLEQDYDLVIFGWQPWFLHPSQPISSFLQSSEAAVLEGKNVVTVIGARNMWLNAEERVKEHLVRLGATLVGNIVLVDTNPNLTSLLTVIRWSFKGQKEAGKWLPAAGVQEKDVQRARTFGPLLLDALNSPEKMNGLQKNLLQAGAVSLVPGLIVLEQRGVKNFRYWAKFIREKGGPGSPARLPRVRLFQRLLLTAIFILSPISSFTAFIKRQLKRKQLAEDVVYFKGTDFEPGRI